WLGRDRRGQDGPGDRGRRRHRVALGTANHRLHASRRDSCPAGREGGVTVGVKPASARRLAGGSPTLLRGLPRLPWIWAAAGCVALLLCCAIGVLAGPVHIGLGTVARALLAPLPWLGTGAAADPGQANILWSLRFPRVVLGVLVGGTLAIAGAAYQGVFRNPLADPYLLGAAAGANLGATLAIAFAPGMSLLGVNIVPLAAFVGAGAAVAGAYALGRSVTGLRSTTGLILAGVAIAAFFNSIQSYVPHTIRLLVGRSYRVVIPLSVLFGAAFLVLADTAARTVVAPAELPIGVITAFLGAPFFIAVMRSTRGAPL